MIEGASSFPPPPASVHPAAANAVPSKPLSKPDAGDRPAQGSPRDIVEISASAKEDEINGLSKEERAEVGELKRQDAETRRHEQAHANAGGQYAGSPSYTYERGPDGGSYAVAGTTPIDVSPVPNDPAATQRKMQVVKRAALAPAEPSPQDRKIAAQAEAERLKAQAELNAGKADESFGEDENDSRQIGAGRHAFSAYTGGAAANPAGVSPLFDLTA